MGEPLILQLENFSIESVEIGRELHLRWQGELTLRDPASKVTPFLDSCLARAENKCVILDFTRVKFMNSSSLIPIIAFVKKLATCGHAGELRYNNQVGWQRVSHNSMKILCQKIPLVKVCYA